MPAFIPTFVVARCRTPSLCQRPLGTSFGELPAATRVRASCTLRTSGSHGFELPIFRHSEGPAADQLLLASQLLRPFAAVATGQLRSRLATDRWRQPISSLWQAGWTPSAPAKPAKEVLMSLACRRLDSQDITSAHQRQPKNRGKQHQMHAHA